MTEKSTACSPFLGAFPSDRIPNAMKDVNVHLFIHRFIFLVELMTVPANSGNFLKLLQNIIYKDNVMYYIFIMVCEIGFSEKVA